MGSHEIFTSTVGLKKPISPYLTAYHMHHLIYWELRSLDDRWIRSSHHQVLTMLVLCIGNVEVPICGWSVMSIGCRFRAHQEIPFTHRAQDLYWILPSSAWLLSPHYTRFIFNSKNMHLIKIHGIFLGGRGFFPHLRKRPATGNYSSRLKLPAQVIPGSSDRLLIFFQGGGACFNDVSTQQAASCLANLLMHQIECLASLGRSCW